VESYSSGKLRIGIGAEDKVSALRVGRIYIPSLKRSLLALVKRAPGPWVVSYTMELRDAVAGAEGKARDKRIGGNRQELVA